MHRSGRHLSADGFGVEFAHSENHNPPVEDKFSIFHGSVVKGHAARPSVTSAGKSLPVHISGASDVYGVAIGEARINFERDELCRNALVSP